MFGRWESSPGRCVGEAISPVEQNLLRVWSLRCSSGRLRSYELSERFQQKGLRRELPSATFPSDGLLLFTFLLCLSIFPGPENLGSLLSRTGQWSVRDNNDPKKNSMARKCCRAMDLQRLAVSSWHSSVSKVI